MKKILKKYDDVMAILLLTVVCGFLFFWKMGHYPLIDVDETRYVSMASDMLKSHDWMTLRLNGEYFFEKPPLYFWMEIIAFSLFGKVNEGIARLPVALFATFTCFMAYFFGRRFVSKEFGLISALILVTSVEFLFLSKIAILDLMLSCCVIISTFFGYYTLFCGEKNKKYFWWLMYFFSALAVMTKGLPGAIIPLGAVFCVYLAIGKIKEFFKPQNILPGGFIFLLITLPWHVLMLKLHGDLFFHEYVVKHHLARFANSEGLGRKEPFYFYIPVFFVGFFPWIFYFIAKICSFFKCSASKIRSFFTNKEKLNLIKFWNDKNDLQKFLVLNVFTFLFIFLFFSSSSTKLPTYILPAIFPAANIVGYYWLKYIKEDDCKLSMRIAAGIFSAILLLAGIGALAAPLFLTPELKKLISPILLQMQLTFILIPLFAIFALKYNRKIALFCSNVALILCITIITTGNLAIFIKSGGQGELIDYAQTAKSDEMHLSTFNYGRRYSALYYYGGKIDFQQNEDYVWLKEKLLKKRNYVIVKNKTFSNVPDFIKYKTVKSGKKYTLIRGEL